MTVIPFMTREQHDRQRALVELATWRSEKRQERRDETAVQARLYSLAERRVQAVPVDPPTRPAA